MSIMNKIKGVCNALVRRSYWYNNIVFPDCSKFWNHRTFDMDVVNLGSTSALFAFNYSSQPQIKATNWAMSPQSLVADYEILRNYCCYLKAGATVIIPLCPFSCLGGSNEYLPDKYYTILDIASMPHASFTRKQTVMNILSNPAQYYPLMQLFLCHTSNKAKPISQDALKSDALMRMKNWMKEFSIICLSDPLSLINQDAYDDGVAIVRNIVSFCIEREFRPVLVMPPVNKALYEEFSKELRELCIDSFVMKATEGKTLFLDYFSDERFTDNDFLNSFVLNISGSKKFTSVVLKDLEIIQ